MSLSARIELDPSGRLAALEAAVPCVGACVAGIALAVRFPDFRAALWTIASLGAAGFLAASWRRWRAARPMTLVLSDRLEVGVVDPAWPDGEARLAPSTVLWPAFAVVALSHPGDGRTVRRPVWLADPAPTERRGLTRYLTWAMRNGGERDREATAG